ncbi:MAG: DnaJ domain-containing protein [Deltaproteobacteria bacterium]|jgi:DnaJ-class molecular chaperone|nr:DnaJ domain-containing protein [Deltaproteobacteria bacterium]
MVTDSLYRELDLNEGASVNEIKAAYRKVAKSCHPDAAAESADPDRFSRANAAYRSLLKEVMVALKTGKQAASKELSGGNVSPCKFIGRKSVGLDVFYDVLVQAPAVGGQTVIRLPWSRQDACPRCLGQGETMKRSGGGFVYRPCTCPRCQGRGFVEEDRTVTLSLTSDMLARGRVRVRNAGSYLPREGRRGDLIVNLRVTEKLPRSN